MPGIFERLYAPVVIVTSLPAPPEDVYAVLTDPTTYPDWLVGAQDTRKIDDEFPAPGASFDHSVGPAGALTIDDSTESLGGRENRNVALFVHAGFFHARVDFVLAPEGADGTRLRFAERPVGIVALLTPFLRLSLKARNAESMRRLGNFLREQVER